MVTIKDVAERTGYSIKTISRAINDEPNVSQKAKIIIREAMQEMNYYPNSVAQQMRGKVTKMIGVVISYITNPFFAYLVDAIEETANQKGYHVVVFQTKDKPKNQMRFLEMLKSKQLDGLILAYIEEENDEITHLIETGKVVVCNHHSPHSKLPGVYIDEKKATYEAITFLITQGYRKIAYCSGGKYDPQNLRFSGFIQALKAHQIQFDETYHFENKWDVFGGQQVVHEMMKMSEIDRPQAIFANGDLLASGILSECLTQGIKVPETLAIIGFDDQPVSQILTPKLTTVQQPIKKMGELSTNILIANLHGETPPDYELLDTVLMIRETT